MCKIFIILLFSLDLFDLIMLLQHCSEKYTQFHFHRIIFNIKFVTKSVNIRFTRISKQILNHFVEDFVGRQCGCLSSN